ncbi:TolC family protein [Lentimicrobium sp. S6]|uniref:TolC family protein n=1 Tax=Lentimicrobium sp. S6 TaxID=2735872 RepID=UPI00155814BE|nr:TolC family protein [Lentimicrobium sp. S6]NPD47842.1 TolC family protein [Lentimicrobium sp. S6]
MKKYYYIFLLAFIPGLLSAQEKQKVFSLQEALEYAKIHNYDYINAQTDIEIAEKKVWESTALGLPQVEGSLSNENYLDIPVTLLPDFISPAVYGVNQSGFGLEPIQTLPTDQQFFPVQFGTKHNATAGVSVNQLLFSGEYIVALRASKTYLGQTERQKVQTEILLIEQVSKSYFLILSLEENLQILDSSLVLNRALLEETRATFEAGFLEDTDVDQLEVIVNNLEGSIRNIQNEITTARAFLKFYMGIQPEEDIALTDDLIGVLDQLNIDYLLGSPFQVQENIDFILFQTQKDLADLQVDLEKSAYLPTINAFFSAQTNAMRDSYSFFDGSLPWYPTTVWGFKMTVPIWSSGNRHAKVQQMKLNMKKMDVSEKQLTSSLQLQVQTARNNFSNMYYNYLNRQKNLEVTVKIYQKTNTKYREGMASSFDLNQAQNNFIQANSDYTMAIMDLLQNKIELEKFLTRSADQFEEAK